MIDATESLHPVASYILEILNEAVLKTQLLMRHSDTTYLEVLTAQQTLLDAEIVLAQRCFDRIQAVINLYHALGAGTDYLYLLE